MVRAGWVQGPLPRLLVALPAAAPLSCHSAVSGHGHRVPAEQGFALGTQEAAGSLGPLGHSITGSKCGTGPCRHCGAMILR